MIAPILPSIIFYICAIFTLAAAMTVILARNPVHSVLALVVVFVNSAVLWMIIDAEFLALVLIFLYVGAVMTLFLFVVMMLNIEIIPRREGFVRFFPITAVVAVVLLGMLVMMFISPDMVGNKQAFMPRLAEHQDLDAIATLLYTHYLYSFEVVGALLLVSIVAAVGLAFQGRRKGTLSQNISEQVAVRAKDRVRLIDMEAE